MGVMMLAAGRCDVALETTACRDEAMEALVALIADTSRGAVTVQADAAARARGGCGGGPAGAAPRERVV